jgi:hypothetical protein
MTVDRVVLSLPGKRIGLALTVTKFAVVGMTLMSFLLAFQSPMLNAQNSEGS